MSCIYCAHVNAVSVVHNGRSLVAVPALSFEKGVVTALLGPSGAGKSTLLRALNRINECWPDMHTTGQVTLLLENSWWRIYPEHAHSDSAPADSVLPLFPLDKLRQKVGMVFQTPHLLPLSIRRNITLPLREGACINATDAEQAMVTALERVGLWAEVKDRLDTAAGRLSGGQMQRLCFARALALQPEILLLDEPTASLDSKATAQVEETITALSRNVSVILVTHSQAQADRLATRHIHIQAGVLNEHSTTHEGTLS